MSDIQHQDFYEIWWIFASGREPWAGLRIAHFCKAMDGTLIFFIADEPPDRMGPRIWHYVSVREGWRKLEQISVPAVPLPWREMP